MILNRLDRFKNAIYTALRRDRRVLPELDAKHYALEHAREIIERELAIAQLAQNASRTSS